MKTAINVILICSGIYLIISFLTLEFDFRLWEMFFRVLFVFAAVVCNFIYEAYLQETKKTLK